MTSRRPPRRTLTPRDAALLASQAFERATRALHNEPHGPHRASSGRLSSADRASQHALPGATLIQQPEPAIIALCLVGSALALLLHAI